MFRSLLDLPSNRLDELFIKFWTLEDAVTAKGAAIKIWRFIANDQSNRLSKFRLASLSRHFFFFCNNSSRRSSRCPMTISLDVSTPCSVHSQEERAGGGSTVVIIPCASGGGGGF